MKAFHVILTCDCCVCEGVERASWDTWDAKYKAEIAAGHPSVEAGRKARGAREAFLKGAPHHKIVPGLK